jgi:diacylglycerol O-acyltransferase
VLRQPRGYDRRRHLARLAATPVVRAQKLLLDGASRALSPDPWRAAGDLRDAGDLPVAERDPDARIAAIHATMTELKDSAAVRAGALLAGATGWAPPLLSTALARGMGEVRAFNLVVSNVPGPQVPFSLNGCRLLAVHPAVPLNPATQGLSVGIISYDGHVCFGLLADRDLDPSLAVAAEGLAAALAELRPAPTA